jgi:hypothetical protein
MFLPYQIEIDSNSQSFPIKTLIKFISATLNYFLQVLYYQIWHGSTKAKMEHCGSKVMNDLATPIKAQNWNWKVAFELKDLVMVIS